MIKRDQPTYYKEKIIPTKGAYKTLREIALIAGKKVQIVMRQRKIGPTKLGRLLGLPRYMLEMFFQGNIVPPPFALQRILLWMFENVYFDGSMKWSPTMESIFNPDRYRWKHVTLYLHPRIAAQAEALAENTGMSMSALAAFAIDKLINNEVAVYSLDKAVAEYEKQRVMAVCVDNPALLQLVEADLKLAEEIGLKFRLRKKAIEYGACPEGRTPIEAIANVHVEDGVASPIDLATDDQCIHLSQEDDLEEV
jgi:hypothetical protein